MVTTPCRYNTALVAQGGQSGTSAIWSSGTYGSTPGPFSLAMQTVTARPPS